MPAEVVPGAGPAPRRARHLIPTHLPRRGEVIAACAVSVLLTHLLFAQLTFVLAVVFAGITKVSRWRLTWLTLPTVAGLVWTLAIGPRAAAAGFAAGPAQILAYLSGGGHPLSRLLHPHGAFAGAGSWLPRQFPLALVAAAAEAALAGWLDWMHTDEWAVPAPRPGALAAVRRAVAGRAIRAGAIVTREGFALGVSPANGARVTLGWPEVAGGVLVAGSSAQEIAVTGLQMVHAALRRRKPVIAVDLSGDPAVAGALAAACAATRTPLQVFGTAGGHYEPFRHADPARRLAMALALPGLDGPAVRTYLGAVFELIDEVPADARTPVLDDVLHLLNPLALQARLGLVSGASPRREQLAESVRAAARVAQADPEGLLAAARELGGVRRSPAGRWLFPTPGGIDLGRVIRQRSAVLFNLGEDGCGVAGLVRADILALGEDLRRIGVDGDGLIWLHGWNGSAGALAELVTGGMAAGLPVLVTTTSPTATAGLAELVNVIVIHRFADASVADRLAAAARTGSGGYGGADSPPMRGGILGGRPPRAAELRGVVPPGQHVVPPGQQLRPGQFVLAVNAPRYRPTERGQAVRARLPRGARP
jgi:hypothetical protein